MNYPFMRVTICAGAVALVISACDNDKSGADKAPAKPSVSSVTQLPPTPEAAAPAVAAAPQPVAEAGAEQPTAELKIAASGVTMVFDVTRFAVTAGQSVHVVFDNRPPGALPHNWVLLKPGKEASYAAFVVEKVKEDYYADSPDVLAHVAMARPGEKTETTFRSPSEPGDYPYICSFPGHYVMMKGVLHVTR